MPYPFDPGYIAEPFLTLCAEYPDSTVYAPDQFSLECGPIFDRGRLDGSACVLVTGSQHLQHPDAPTPLVLYGENWVEGDRVAIPRSDPPPASMRGCTSRTAGRNARGRHPS
jgi:hypothetical protein